MPTTLLAGPLQQHEVLQPPVGIVGVTDQHRRAAIDEARNEPPMRPRGVVAEIRRHALLPFEAHPVDDLEAHVLGQHGPDRVEVMRIEALDIGLEPRPFRLGQGRNRSVVGLPGERAKADPPSLQGRLDRRHAAADDLADLLQGIAEHVAQDDAAALRRRQPHEGSQAGRRDLAILDGVPHGRDHVQILVRMPGLPRAPVGAGSPKPHGGRCETANPLDWRSARAGAASIAFSMVS